MNLDFGAILGKAWKITWEHKVLWIFGILASLGAGGGGDGNTSYQFSQSDFGRGPGGGPELPPRIQRFFDQIDPSVLIAIVVGLVCLGLLIGLILLVLSVIGRGGLIGGVRLAEANGQVTFGEAWGVGTRKFWVLFLIGLLVGVVTLALAVTVVVPGVLLSIVTLGLGVLCLIPLICVLAIVAAVLGVIGYFAQIAAVVEDLSLGAAFSRAWEIIKANLGSIIILGIILFVVSGIVGFIIALPLLLIVVPVLLALIGFARESQTLGNAGLIIAALCCVAYFPVLLVLGGVLQTWVTATWTLAYEQFSGRSLAPAPAPA